MEWLVRTTEGEVVHYSQDRLIETLREASDPAGMKNLIDCEGIALHIEGILYHQFFKPGTIPSTAQISQLMVEELRRLGFVPIAKVLSDRKAPRPLQEAEKLINSYLDQSDWRVHENSNMNYSLQGLNFHLASTMVAQYWLHAIYPEPVRQAHDQGEMHIHDLGVLGPYCVGWDLMDLLMRGFGGVPNKIESSPAKHFRTVLGQVNNFFYTLQGEAAGAQAFSNFDTYLAPFVRYDKLEYDEVKQCLQEFIFNLNVPTRVGFQAPFTNITLDLTPSPALADTPVIIGGKPMPETYGEFQPEMDLINRAIAELMSQGDARGRIFTFPIPTYNIHKTFDFENPNLEAIWTMTGKYGIPYFSNFVNSDLNPDDVRSMCCRLRLDARELQSRGGGLFGANPLTGSIGVVTLNLPRIGYLAHDRDDFFARLDALVDKAKIALELRRERVEELTDRGLYPYTSVYLRNVKDRFGLWWANHFSTIGIVGMNEACLNFLQKPITEPESREFAQEVLNFLRNKLQEIQEETGNYYNLEATPAESTSFRLARKDREAFPQIFAQGTDTVPYYTNSVHVPATVEMDIFDLLNHQDDLQVLFTGGTVVHLYLGEAITDPNAVKELVKSIVHRFRMPYFSITPTFSICPVHNYVSGKHFSCPLPHTDEEMRMLGTERKLHVHEISEMDPHSFRDVSHTRRSEA
jgi:ribonucleoside-triphosphate reductase